MKKKLLGKHLPIYLMALPGLLYLFINNYMPMGGLVVAFKNFSAKKGIWGSDWVGLKNFTYLFADAWTITRNTILYNITFIILGNLLAVTIAILLSEIASKKMGKFYQSVILLPHLISWVIISYLVYAFLSADSGFINNTILGLAGKDPISWYNEAKYWPFIIVFVFLWQSTGYSSIVYFATVVGFDKGYYEAAELEGAGPWKKIRYITLPLLKPVIITMVMLAVGRIFYSDFGLFYQIPMNSGAVYSTTNVIDTYVYRGLLQQGNIGMSAAAGLYQSLVGFIVVMTANLLVRKADKENAFF
ncbi:putative aldouronate transport system permease protein [Anaerocolumna jejuensis DSM 15929]|uniref:Putative aldouronate transport system permease protein n=1 Tax=Anaerocolumna jejuensis DSM 15929 TaxID=1121322 RepID=A0A1M6P458_9FIRM|nr:ABC transporter permease subunit [Anaerocolumna jejuensis]SHK02711.1 putative aldouronate transport system permease protein [Anaerocolumna jejuensis DSM 15929]